MENFKEGNNFTLGVELELQIVNKNTLNLTPKSRLILENIPAHLKPYIQPEYLQSMIEVITPVYETPGEVISSLKKILKEIIDIGNNFNFTFLALGTTPTKIPKNIKITEDIRYQKLLEEFQIVLRRFFIYGFHIHIGVPNKDVAINVYNALINYLPCLIAISASSPFFEGIFTGLQSYRTKIFEQLPRADIPQYFENYEEFKELIDILKAAEVIQKYKDIWWDVRIRPDLGTVEIRVADSNPDFLRLELILAFVQSIAYYYADKKIKKEYYQVLKQNKWNAARHGYSGKFISSSDTTTIGERCLDLLKLFKYKGIFKKFDVKKSNAFENLLMEKNIAEKMIKKYQNTADLKEVMKIGLLKP